MIDSACMVTITVFAFCACGSRASCAQEIYLYIAFLDPRKIFFGELHAHLQKPEVGPMMVKAAGPVRWSSYDGNYGSCEVGYEDPDHILEGSAYCAELLADCPTDYALSDEVADDVIAAWLSSTPRRTSSIRSRDLGY